MNTDNLSQLKSIIENETDEILMLKQIVKVLKNLLKIDIIIADTKNVSLNGKKLEPKDYFYKIPLKAANVKYGMIYSNDIDKITSKDMATFYAAVPMISLLLRNVYVQNDVRIKRLIKVARVVIGSLTVTETAALKAVFDIMHEDENVVVISSVANRIGITRSIIVNALKKIESAGIIDSRSLGMKGTKIEIINRYFLNELKDC